MTTVSEIDMHRANLLAQDKDKLASIGTGGNDLQDWWTLADHLARSETRGRLEPVLT